MSSPVLRPSSAPACARILFKDEVVSSKICSICERVCAFGNFIFSRIRESTKEKEYLCSKECLEVYMYEMEYLNGLKSKKEKQKIDLSKKIDVTTVALSPRKSVTIDVPPQASEEAKKIIRRQVTPFNKHG